MSNYSIWVLEYAYTSSFPKSIVVHGAHDQQVRFSYSYVLIKGKDHVAMVDVGFDNREYGKTLNDRFGIENWHSPHQVLSMCDLAPEQVRHVFVTHAHFDHFGASDYFPKATFYIQERELTKWIWASALDQRFRWLNAAIDPGDLVRALNLAQQRRLICVDGPMENVLPGIDLCPAFDTHTPGSQYVLVRNDGKRETSDGWVLAGDLVYQFENLSGPDPQDPYYVPIGLASGSQTNLLMTMDEMVSAVGGDATRVIPVHEAKLKDRFPSRLTSDGLWIVELALASGDNSLVG